MVCLKDNGVRGATSLTIDFDHDFERPSSQSQAYIQIQDDRHDRYPRTQSCIVLQ